MSDESQDGLWINGELITVDDLTFREQRKMRDLIKELAPDPDVDVDDLPVADVLPAIVTVVMQRTDPGFELEQALDMRLADFAVPEEPARPTRAAKKAAASGAQS